MVRAAPARPGALAGRTNLVRELALTQFKLKYTGSVLGYLWSLVNPLVTFAIMYVVFARILRINARTPHFPLQLLLGIVVWSFFAETVGNAIAVVVSNTSLVKKAFFPRSILVIASSLSSCLTFVINLVLVVVVAIPLHQIDLGVQSLAAIPLVLELYALILGLSLLLSGLYVFYRDIGHIWTIGSLVLFYGSAIVFPLTPDFLGERATLLALNPVAQIVEDLRHCLITSRTPWTSAILHSAAPVPVAAVAVILAAGYVAFRRLSPRFAEAL